MGLGGGKGQSQYAALHVALPPRGTQPREGRYDVDAAVVGDAGRQSLHLRGIAHQLQLVANPFQGGSCAVDVALVAEVGLAEGRESYAGHQSGRSWQRLFSDVHHDAAARAVGHLARAGLETHLPDQRSVRVAQYTGNLDGVGEQPLAGGLAIDGVAGFELRHYGAWNVEQLQQVVVPLHGVDVEQHGARGIGIVGSVYTSACQLPDEPRLDGSHQQFAVLGLLAGTLYVVEQPLDARCREVGVYEQSALVEHALGIAL